MRNSPVVFGVDDIHQRCFSGPGFPSQASINSFVMSGTLIHFLVD